jgi:hypothetical protein
MDEITPPFFANDRGDLSIFDSMKRMASQIEVYDVDDNEFFDARGRRLAATTEGYRVTGFGPRPGVPAEPTKLEALLRDYFRRLPERCRSYSEAAAQASSLDELVRLRWDFENRPRPRLLRRIFWKGRRFLGGQSK